jgi:hypothetical protein
VCRVAVPDAPNSAPASEERACDYCAGDDHSYHYDDDHNVDKRFFVRLGVSFPRIGESCWHVVRPAVNAGCIGTGCIGTTPPAGRSWRRARERGWGLDAPDLVVQLLSAYAPESYPPRVSRI